MPDPSNRVGPGTGRDAALAVLCVAQLMLILDFSIVNVALPAIQRALGFDDASVQWVISAYALAFGGFLMLGGRAADLFGRRRVFGIGMALFTAASLLGGFADRGWVLIAARALQGVGGAIVSPAALSLLTTTFAEGPERNRAMGWFGTMSTVGFGVGMLVGGALTDSAGWEWVMFINVPIGLAVLALAPRLLPEGAPEPRPANEPGGFDVAGATLITVGASLLVYALADGGRAGWGSSRTLGAFGGAIAALAAFVAVEARVRRPLVPLGVFRRRDLVGSNLVGFFLAAGVPAMILLATLQMQRNLGYSTWRTGLAFLPHAVVAFLAARAVPRAVDRFGARAVMAWGSAGFGLSVLLLLAITPDGPYWLELLPGLAITPIGILMGFVACTIGATDGMPDDEQGLASGLLQSAEEIGQALGLALILNVVAAAESAAHAAGLADAAARASGYRWGFAVEAVFATLAVMAAVFVVRRRAQPARS